MTPVAPIEAGAAALAQAAPLAANAAPLPEPNAAPGFADMLSHAGQSLEASIDRADELTRRFVVGEDIPAHEVVIALEQARLAVELAVEVRTRTIEAYREIMNMQL